MWSGVTVRARGRVERRATQELVLSQHKMPQTLGLTVQSQKCTVKYQRLYLVQNEGTAEMRKSLWVVYVGGGQGGRRGQRRQLRLVKKCRDCRFGVTEPHLSFTGTELPK